MSITVTVLVILGQKVNDIQSIHHLLIFLSSEKANRARTPDEEEEIIIPQITYTMTIFSLAELAKPHAHRQPKARFVILASDLEWLDVRAQLKIKAVDVLFPNQAAVDDEAFEIEFSIARQVPTPLPLLSENDYKHLVQNALKVKANPAVKITIKEVAGKENVPPLAPEPVPSAPTTPRGQGAAAAAPKGKKSKV